MKISKIIEKLEKLKKEHGDIEVIEIYKTDNEDFVEEITDIKYISKYESVAIIICEV